MTEQVPIESERPWGKPPAISVGMPVYNEAGHLSKAIESILAQTFTDFELIISDNNSDDETPRICADYASRDPRIKFFRNDSNHGQVWNFNHVFNLSIGKYFMWASGRDFRHPRFLAGCFEALERHQSANLCYPEVVLMVDEEKKLHIVSRKPDPRDIIRSVASRLLNSVGFSSIADTHGLPAVLRFLSIHWGIVSPDIYGLIRTEALRKTRLYRTTMGTDLVLLAELSLLGEFILLPKPMHFRYVGSTPGDLPRSNEELKKVLNRLYGPGRVRRVWFPTWREVFEHIGVVSRGRLPRLQKMILVLMIVFRFLDLMAYDLYRGLRSGPLEVG